MYAIEMYILCSNFASGGFCKRTQTKLSFFKCKNKLTSEKYMFYTFFLFVVIIYAVLDVGYFKVG
jgi:hypothetical protein